jgi:hypothetical protein
MPNGTTNSFAGRVHGAVDARSVYTPADPAVMSTVVALPAAIAPAASTMPGSPKPDIERQTGPMRAWYEKSCAPWPMTPSRSRSVRPASATAPRPAANVIERESWPSSTRACSVL